MEGDEVNSAHTFKIITTKRTLLLCAPSEDDEIKWMGAIRALIVRRNESGLVPGKTSKSTSASHSYSGPGQHDSHVGAHAAAGTGAGSSAGTSAPAAGSGMSASGGSGIKAKVRRLSGASPIALGIHHPEQVHDSKAS